MHLPKLHPLTVYFNQLLRQHPLTSVMLFFAICFAPTLFAGRDLWVQDEMRYGEVVREMLVYHQWLVPHLNLHPYPDKPPVYFWIVSALSLVSGNIVLSFKIVTFLSTGLAVFLLFQFSSRVLGQRAAVQSCIIFCTCLLTMIVGNIIRMDMLLTASVIFSLSQLMAFQTELNSRRLRLFWIGCLSGIAIKGPIALLFTLLPALGLQFFREGWHGLKQLQIVRGLLSLCALILLWIALVTVSGHADYLNTVWQKQLVGRTVNAWSHPEPYYFYWVLLPVLLLPWTGLVASGVYAMIKEKQTHLHSLLFFVAIPLIALSMVSGKLFIYLQPLIPTLSMIAAYAYTRKLASSVWLNMPLLTLFVLVGGLCLWLNLHEEAAQLRGLAWVAAGLAGVTAWYGVKCLLEKNIGLSSVVMSLIVFAWLASVGLPKVLNPWFSGRAVTQSLVTLQAPSAAIATVNVTRGTLNFYLQKTVDEISPADLIPWLQAHAEGSVIIKSKDLPKTFPVLDLTARCHQHQQFKVELKQYDVFAACKI